MATCYGRLTNRTGCIKNVAVDSCAKTIRLLKCEISHSALLVYYDGYEVGNVTRKCQKPKLISLRVNSHSPSSTHRVFVGKTERKFQIKYRSVTHATKFRRHPSDGLRWLCVYRGGGVREFMSALGVKTVPRNLLF